MKPTILIVIPTYGHFDYAAKAVETALNNTRTLDPHVLVVDDASPELEGGVIDTAELKTMSPGFQALMAVVDRYDANKAWCHYYKENGGLTRSWNHGLNHAHNYNFDYCCVTNSDVFFPKGWDKDIADALKTHALVGPVTNAPGSNPEQYVHRYSLVYDPEHPADKIQEVQDELAKAQAGRYKKTVLNGFCMIGRTKIWHEHAYAPGQVFCPRNDFNSKGERNPTPS